MSRIENEQGSDSLYAPLRQLQFVPDLDDLHRRVRRRSRRRRLATGGLGLALGLAGLLLALTTLPRGSSSQLAADKNLGVHSVLRLPEGTLLFRAGADLFV